MDPLRKMAERQRDKDQAATDVLLSIDPYMGALERSDLFTILEGERMSGPRRAGIYVEVKPYGGTAICNAVLDIVNLATRLRIDVWCEMNGICVLARPDDDVSALFDAWQDALSSRRGLASTRGESKND